MVTEMDGSALMYRVKFFESLDREGRKERKAASVASFGKTYKKGHLTTRQNESEKGEMMIN